MTSPAYRSYSQQAFEKYYARTYSGHVSMRVGSITLVAMVLLFLKAISLWVVLGWIAAYVSSEVATMAWWRRIGPRLAAATQDQRQVFQNQLIAITTRRGRAAPPRSSDDEHGGHDIGDRLRRDPDDLRGPAHPDARHDFVDRAGSDRRPSL
jgi:hypothetical protein